MQCYFFVISYTTTRDNNFEILLKEHYLVSIFAKINCLCMKSNLSKLKLCALVAFSMLLIVNVHKAKHNLLLPFLICVTWKFIRTPRNIGLQLQLVHFMHVLLLLNILILDNDLWPHGQEAKNSSNQVEITKFGLIP